MGYTTTIKHRPLQIRFDTYGAGDDNEFKFELVTLMGGSIRELQRSAIESCAVGNSDLFKKAVHKAKSTLSLLDDNEFLQVIDKFEKSLMNTESKPDFKMQIPDFERLSDFCESIIASLEKEAMSLKLRI